MGGALALHSGFNVNHDLAGVFACSSFLNDDSIVFEVLRKRKTQQNSNPLPKLLMYHGDRDNLVPLSWGQETFNELVQFGAIGEFRSLKNTLHELKGNELRDIHEWILKQMPPLDSDVINKL